MLEWSFLFVAGYSLIQNLIKDVKTLKIDSRYNFLALGAALMLCGANSTPFISIGIAIAITILSGFLFSKFMAEGDTEAFSWIFLSLASMNIFSIPIFLTALALSFAFGLGIKRIIKAQNNNTPGYIYIASAYAIAIATII